MQIRKSKREEQLMKRRQAPQPVDNNDNSNAGQGKKSYSKEDIPDLMKLLTGANPTPNDLYVAVQGFRRMLSVEVNPPVDAVLEAGALPYFVKFLEMTYSPDLVFEAAWALTNIASTNMTRSVVDAGAVPALVHHLQSKKDDIREQCAWCLGNIAGDCHELRDFVLHQGALNGLILNVNEPTSMTLLSNFTWAVSNLCRGKPSPPGHLIEPAIGPLASLLSRNVSDEVIVDACWALSYLADGDNDRIQMLMDTKITDILVNLLNREQTLLLTPVVRTLGNFVTGDDSQTQVVVDAGVIKPASKLLQHPNRNIRKETTWLLSNIAAGTIGQIDSLFHEVGLLEKVVAMSQEDRWEIRKEAIWVVSNIFTTGNEYHVRSLVQRDGLNSIVDVLTTQDPKMIIVALEAIEKVLAVGEQLNLGYNTLVDEYNGIDALELLQEHQNEQIYEKAVDILERFFQAEDEEDENVAPLANNDGTFSFGLPPSKQLFPAENTEDGPNGNVLGSNNFDFTMGM